MKVHYWSWELQFDKKRSTNWEFYGAFTTSHGLHPWMEFANLDDSRADSFRGWWPQDEAESSWFYFSFLGHKNKQTHTDCSLWPSFVHRCWWKKMNVWKWSCPELRWHWLRLRWRRTRCCTAWRTSKSTPARPGSLFTPSQSVLQPPPPLVCSHQDWRSSCQQNN